MTEFPAFKAFPMRSWMVLFYRHRRPVHHLNRLEVKVNLFGRNANGEVADDQSVWFLIDVSTSFDGELQPMTQRTLARSN